MFLLLTAGEEYQETGMNGMTSNGSFDSASSEEVRLDLWGDDAGI